MISSRLAINRPYGIDPRFANVREGAEPGGAVPRVRRRANLGFPTHRPAVAAPPEWASGVSGLPLDRDAGDAARSAPSSVPSYEGAAGAAGTTRSRWPALRPRPHSRASRDRVDA